MKHLGYLAIASAVVISFLGSTVGLAQTRSTAADSPQTTASPSENTTGSSQIPSPGEAHTPSVLNAQETPLNCPANYFASKFSDVTPYDWAYEAVNRIASGEMRCFPLTNQPVQSR